MLFMQRILLITLTRLNTDLKMMGSERRFPLVMLMQA